MRSPLMHQITRLSQFLAALCLLSLSVFVGCHGVPEPALKQLGEARSLAADLRFQFSKGVGASDRAVMADTDEASVAFAGEATKATETAEADRTGLASPLQSLGYQDEIKLLDEFSEHFAEYRKLDHDVLELAVENTNLKAQRLSFGPVRDAANAFRDALGAVAGAAPVKDRCRAENLVSQAVLAVRDIQVLQAPHIAEAEDAVMDQLEKQMATLDESAHVASTALAAIANLASAPEMATANADLARFEGVSKELIALSRRNSNVRSLKLSLSQKPVVAAACDANLAALTDSLSRRGSNATR